VWDVGATVGNQPQKPAQGAFFFLDGTDQPTTSVDQG
jgi:hypothetical protein